MWKIRQTASPRDEEIIPETNINLSKTVLSPEVIRTMADEIEVAKAIRLLDNQSEFPLIVNDLPVTHRQIKQGWRYLRRFSREGTPIELDLEATIQKVAQQGILLNPVLVPRRTNRIELLLLIDQDGSMVPFHHLSQELADTASRGGRFSRVRVYYFHNCPDEYLYRDRYHLNAVSIDDCLSNLPPSKTVCLIFSDAGAARGGFSSRRRRLTKFFLKELGQYVRYTAWLNPVPRQRWENTTAHDIAALVPMFEVNRQEFYKAINVLRGRHQPLGDSLR
ncbi:VWA domain-containing protein [Iningainema sp. BLCCT55]|uniref:VWA domain-containing protein n=2 Tax=Iningainema TaxID=1932705 RepID=A0A8J6XY04_9CYAN|nr:VWA domain-containing protein [Iningainema tapete BLCC-T55]